MYLHVPRNRDFFESGTQLLHGCRQFVSWDVHLSVVTNATRILCYFSTRNCLATSGEEGADDVKSAWCLYPGQHTSYNGADRGLPSREAELIPKRPPSSDCRLQLACMKSELLVIAGQHTAVNTFSPLVHTARQARRVGGTRRRLSNPALSKSDSFLIHLTMYYVYVLKSFKTNQLYIGFSTDLKKRVEDHNNGKSIYTKKYIPWELIYYESYKSETDARMRESQLKNYGSSLQKLKQRISNSLE